MDALRLALVSDIHGNLPALEAVVADLRRRGVDAVVNLGDSLSGPLYPRETAHYLMEQDWVQLAGNHERQILDDSEPRGASDLFAADRITPAQRTWIAGLRPSAVYAPDIFLCHGTPSSDLVYLLETVDAHGVRAAHAAEVDERLGGQRRGLVACGHSHRPRCVRLDPGPLIVNPGSVGLPGFRAGLPLPHVVENGSPDARYAIVERRGGAWSAALIAVPYDHTAVADLAAARGRPDWARALRSGWLHD